MSKVTSKLQVTIPKKLAETYGIEPGSTIHFESSGDSIRIRIPGASDLGQPQDREVKVKMFDAATDRQEARNRRLMESVESGTEPTDRGWKREDLYDRAVPR